MQKTKQQTQTIVSKPLQDQPAFMQQLVLDGVMTNEEAEEVLFRAHGLNVRIDDK